MVVVLQKRYVYRTTKKIYHTTEWGAFFAKRPRCSPPKRWDEMRWDETVVLGSFASLKNGDHRARLGSLSFFEGSRMHKSLGVRCARRRYRRRRRRRYGTDVVDEFFLGTKRKRKQEKKKKRKERKGVFIFSADGGSGDGSRFPSHTDSGGGGPDGRFRSGDV